METRNENPELEIVTDEIMAAKHNNAMLAEARQAVAAYFANPSDENQDAVVTRTNAVSDLFRMVKDYTNALANLQKQIEFAVVSLYDYAPELAERFKLQGSKSVKCDASKDSMRRLMDAFVAEGGDPSGLFGVCSVITAKKAAEAFGLSEGALLEKHGDLFETHYSKPQVKLVD